MANGKWAATIALTAVVFAVMALSQAYVINNEITKKPLTTEKLNERDSRYFYNLYMIGEPLKENRQFIGAGDAPISFVAYLDAESEVSRHFIEQAYPQLKEAYINTGIIKFYPKHYLTKADLDSKKSRYMKEKALDCVRILAPDQLEDAYLSSFGNKTLRAAERGIDEDGFKSCLEGKDSEELLTDLSETEHFEIGRSNARFFIGVEGTNSIKIEGIPPYASLKRQLEELKLRIGE